MTGSGTRKKTPANFLWITASIGGAVAVWMWPHEKAEPTRSVTPVAPLAAIEKIPLPSGPERQVSDEIDRAVGKSSPLDKTSTIRASLVSVEEEKLTALKQVAATTGPPGDSRARTTGCSR